MQFLTWVIMIQSTLRGFSICRVMTISIQITVLHNSICLMHYFNNFVSVLQCATSTLLKGERIIYWYCLCCKDY